MSHPTLNDTTSSYPINNMSSPTSVKETTTTTTTTITHKTSNTYKNVRCPVVFQLEDGMWVTCVVDNPARLEFDFSGFENWKNLDDCEETILNLLSVDEYTLRFKTEIGAHYYSWVLFTQLHNHKDIFNYDKPIQLCRCLVKNGPEKPFYVFRLRRYGELSIETFQEEGTTYSSFFPMPPPLHKCKRSKCGLCDHKCRFTILNTPTIFTETPTYHKDILTSYAIKVCSE